MRPTGASIFAGNLANNLTGNLNPFQAISNSNGTNVTNTNGNNGTNESSLPGKFGSFITVISVISNWAYWWNLDLDDDPELEEDLKIAERNATQVP